MGKRLKELDQAERLFETGTAGDGLSFVLGLQRAFESLTAEIKLDVEVAGGELLE
jgi:hypothetical protein